MKKILSVRPLTSNESSALTKLYYINNNMMCLNQFIQRGLTPQTDLRKLDHLHDALSTFINTINNLFDDENETKDSTGKDA